MFSNLIPSIFQGCLDWGMLAKQSDDIYMAAALEEARKAYRLGEVPVGAVLVTGNTIIAKKHNSVQRSQDATAHAELRVLQAGCAVKKTKYLLDCTLYVTLEPCAMCAMACYWLQIKRLVFGTHDTKRGYGNYTPCLLHPKTSISAGVLQKESCSILRRFFQALR